MKLFNSLRCSATLVLLLALVVPAEEAWARIYKTVDADGNVVFSDVPPTSTPADTVELQPGSAYSPPVAAAQPDADERSQQRTRSDFPGDDPDADEAPPPVTYQAIEITSPSADQAIRENAGNVTVQLRTVPALDAKHSIRLLLNGAAKATSKKPSIELQNIDRGTHVITAQVIDDQGATAISSKPVTFHLLRTSVQQRRRVN